MVYRPVQCLFSLLILTTAWGYPNKPNLQGAAVDPSISVQRTMDCPTGLELVGKSCVSTQILKPNLVCPPSTKALKNDCVILTKGVRVCPDNCVKVGDRCDKTEVIPATAVCDKGDISGDECLTSAEVPPTCPTGFQLLDGQCLRYTSQIKNCPAGYQLQNTQCVQRNSFPPSPVCPPGYSLAGDELCSKSVPVPPRCDSGFTLVGTECVKDVPRVPSSCPSGYQSLPNSCHRERQTQPRAECPQGFALGPQNQCTKKIPVPPTCPEGTTRGTTQQCERPVAREPICDKGEQLINGRCQQSYLSPSELQCPNGYELVNRECQKVLLENPRVRCSRGVLESDNCVMRSTTPTRVHCPPGYEMAKGFRCVRDVAYDCPKSIVHSECNFPAVNEYYGVRRLHGVQKPPALMNSKSNLLPATRTSGCYEQQPCTRLDVVPLQYLCPNGSPPQGKTCPVTSTYPPDVYCTVGQLDQEKQKCVAVDTKPAMNVCHVGRIQPDGSCLEINEKPPTFVCPDGTTQIIDRCIVFVRQVEHDDKVVRQEPKVVCDEGTMRGKECIQVDELPRSEVCPFGTRDVSGHCVISRPLVISPPVVASQPPSYVCPNGGPAIDKSCSTTSVVPPEYLCQSGVMKDALCLHVAELIRHPLQVTRFAPRPTCPTEYQQQGSQCSKTTSEKAKLECPPGYVLLNAVNECGRFEARVPVCPTGTEKIGGDCVKKTFTPPRVTEVKVCTKGQPGC